MRIILIQTRSLRIIMQSMKHLYYLKDPALAALQTNTTQLTVVTPKAIEVYSATVNYDAYEITQNSGFQFSVPSSFVSLVIPYGYRLLDCKYFPREGYQDLLLAVITDDKQFYLVVLDYRSGRIVFSSPAFDSAPCCYFYSEKVIFYALGNIVYSWSINTVPKCFFVGYNRIVAFCFAKIAFRSHVIVAEEQEVYTVDLLTGQRAFTLNTSGRPRLLVLNDFLNYIFVCTEDDIFYIFDLELAFSSKIRPPNIEYYQTGYFYVRHAIPRATGYLVANKDSELFDVEVIYEAPATQLSDRMKMVLNYYGFDLHIRAKQRIFNQPINIIGISKISADYFYACTTSCAVCGITTTIYKCTDEHVSFGVSSKVRDLNGRLRKNLMTQSTDYLNEFVDNIENYYLGETADLLEKKYYYVSKDFFQIIKAYAFSEQGEFWETISTPWEGHPDNIQVAPHEEDETKIGLDPYYKQHYFRVMNGAETAEYDLELFLQLTMRKFTENPVEDARSMGLSDYVNSYLPYVAPAIWKMSQNYYLAKQKMTLFNVYMANKQEFLKGQVLLLFSTIEELEGKTAESYEALTGYIKHYYDSYLDFLDYMLADNNSVQYLLNTAIPMHMHNKLAFSYYQRLIMHSAQQSARRIIEFFKMNGAQDLITPGQNPVSETIAEQLSFNSDYKQFYKILYRFEIGKGQMELFAVTPNNLNYILLHVETFIDYYAERLKYIDYSIKAMRTIDTKTLPFEQKIMFHEIYDMVEVNSCTPLLFMATTTLRNNIDALQYAIMQSNEQNKGSFYFLTLYDVREFAQSYNRIKVIFHHHSKLFRLSDIMNHVCQDLLWLNPRNKSWLDNYYIDAALKANTIGLQEIKQIVANLVKAAQFVQYQDVLATAFAPGDVRVVGWLDPTTVFLDLETLEVHIPYFFEPFRDFCYLKAKLVDGVCYRAPEVLLGVPQATSDVYSIALLFVALYYTFVFVPKQKLAKKRDIKPLSLYIANIAHFVQLTDYIDAENMQIYYQYRIKNPPNLQQFLPDVYSRFLVSIMRAQASLCMDIANVPQQYFASQIMTYMLKGNKENLKAAQFYLNQAIFYPYANAEKYQEKNSHALYYTNKYKYQKFTELIEKGVQQVLKKCIIFNAEVRMSLTDLLAQWKFEPVVRSQAQVVEQAAETKSSVFSEAQLYHIQFPGLKPCLSGEDLSESSAEPYSEDSASDFEVQDLIDKIIQENEPSEEEPSEELPEEQKKEVYQKQQKQLQIEAFKEMYYSYFGVLPNDMDLDALMAENCVDFELPEEERVVIDLEQRDTQPDDKNFFEEAAENPEKFEVAKKAKQSDETEPVQISKSMVTSVVNAMEVTKSLYETRPEEYVEQIEEYEVPEDFQQEGKETVDVNEERNWFELAAEEAKVYQEFEKQEKQARQARKLARYNRSAESESSYDYEEEESEEESEEDVSYASSSKHSEPNAAPYKAAETEQHVDSKSDKPIWAIDSDEDAAVVQNGEVEDSSVSGAESVSHGADGVANDGNEQVEEHEIMFDEDGRAFWFDEAGEMHYVE